MMVVCVLQQFGCGAVPRAAGRDQSAPGEDLADGERLSARVADAILIEDPGLQGGRSGGAFRSGRHGGNLRLPPPEIPVRRRQVIDGRHESRERRPSAHRPAERIQEALPPHLIHHFQYAQHLALLQRRRSGGNIRPYSGVQGGDQFLRGGDNIRRRRITERVSKRGVRHQRKRWSACQTRCTGKPMTL